MTERIHDPLLHRALLALTVNSLIALALSLFDEHGLWMNMVYSQCIGLSIWGLIEVALRWLVSDWDQQWRRLVLLVPLAVVIGYLLGTLLADTLLQHNSLGYLGEQPGKFWGLLLMSLGVGTSMAYFYLSRSQLVAQRQRTEQALRLAAESRLKLLETQLEPHMLFNTLANLRMLISIDPERAQAMLDHLIAYLRTTLSASRTTTHTLEQEFDRLRDYLALMEVRMGPRLQYTLDLPQNLRGLAVPALLLQPLVENSIKHGLEPKVEGGHITIRASLQGQQGQQGQYLCLEVADTGCGLKPANETADQSGFGLTQVRERLVTLYGAAGTLKLVAVPAGGASATVVFPMN
ncbi:MAG: histidine kinase [Rhodoferax sp.]|nr:histidine kinase [Rhodoferax sp.]